MSDTNRKQPDFTVHIVQERTDSKPQWFEVGAVWKGAKGLSGDTVFGRLVLMPVEPKSAEKSKRAR